MGSHIVSENFPVSRILKMVTVLKKGHEFSVCADCLPKLEQISVAHAESDIEIRSFGCGYSFVVSFNICVGTPVDQALDVSQMVLNHF